MMNTTTHERKSRGLLHRFAHNTRQICTLSLFMLFSIGSMTAAEYAEITSFRGKAFRAQGVIILKWTTLSEQDNDSFTVKRSTDNQQTWTTIGTVNGQGHSSVISDYSFTDSEPQNGHSHYMLAWRDLNGEHNSVIKVSYLRNAQYAVKSFAPVDGFNASYAPSGHNVEMKWSVSTDFTGNEFRITRSSNNGPWQDVAIVPFDPNTSTVAVLRAIDERAEVGSNEYKLSWSMNGEPFEARDFIRVSKTPDAKNMISEPTADADGSTDLTRIGNVSGSYTENGHLTQLKWTVPQGFVANRFNISRSVNGGAFSTLGSVLADQHENEPFVYRFDDGQPINGSNIYKVSWAIHGEEFSKNVRIRVVKSPNARNSPTHLASLDAEYIKNTHTVALNWRVNSDFFSEEFEVLKFSHTNGWEFLATVNGVDEPTTTTETFTFNDSEPGSGSLDYQVRWMYNNQYYADAVTVIADNPGPVNGGDEVAMFTPIAATVKHAEVVKFAALPLKTAGEVLISWETLSEEQNEIFALFRSTNRENWEKVATLDSKGNSNRTKGYSFTDQGVQAGHVFYKLEWHDEYGKMNKTTLATEVPESAVVYTSFPNPTIGTVRISSKEEIDAGTKAKVVSITGHRYRVPVKYVSGELELDLTEVPKGIYMIQLNDGFVRVQKD